MISNFSDNLKQLRLAKGYTQEQAAEVLKVSPQSISRWECGNTFPDIMLLPEIARLYCVTVDDLYQPHSIAYRNYAARLASVYGDSGTPEDFIRADAEFAKLIKSGQHTMDDLRLYGLIYQRHMNYCKNKAFSLYDQALAMGADTDKETYYRVKIQKNSLLSQIGKGKECIQEQEKLLAENPDNPEESVGLLDAYFSNGEYEEAYCFFHKAIQKFPNVAMLYVYGGDTCRKLGKYKEALHYLETASSLEAKYYDAKFSIAFCYEEMGEYEKAYPLWVNIAESMEKEGLDADSRFPRTLAEKCLEKCSKAQ